MGKRRTRKDKLLAKHHWQPSSGTLVKRQTAATIIGINKSASVSKKADLLEKDAPLPSIKKAIVRSLILASLVLGIELVLYLAWSAS